MQPMGNLPAPIANIKRHLMQPRTPICNNTLGLSATTSNHSLTHWAIHFFSFFFLPGNLWLPGVGVGCRSVWLGLKLHQTTDDIHVHLTIFWVTKSVFKKLGVNGLIGAFNRTQFWPAVTIYPKACIRQRKLGISVQYIYNYLYSIVITVTVKTHSEEWQQQLDAFTV